MCDSSCSRQRFGGNSLRFGLRNVKSLAILCDLEHLVSLPRPVCSPHLGYKCRHFPSFTFKTAQNIRSSQVGVGRRGFIPICSDFPIFRSVPICAPCFREYPPICFDLLRFYFFRFVFRTNQANPFLLTPFANPRNMDPTTCQRCILCFFFPFISPQNGKTWCLADQTFRMVGSKLVCRHT